MTEHGYQETAGAPNPDGAVPEVGRGHRSGSEENGRKFEAQDEEQPRFKEAIKFLRYYFGIGNEGITDGEALDALVGVLSLLRGHDVPDEGFRAGFQAWKDRVGEEPR
jgi:hypothetical protein